MSKPLSLAILAIGIVLLVWGISAGDSFASEAKELVTGNPTDRSMGLIIAGVLAIVVGGFSSFSRRHN